MISKTEDSLGSYNEGEGMFERYARQIIMPEIGKTGQEKLMASHIMVAGVGGLGSFSSLYLAAIGIGCLTLIDSGSIAMSDLNRQVLYSPETVGQPKVYVAEKKLREFNPDVVVETVFGEITEESLSGRISRVDAVVDATDNFKTRRILNRVCFRECVPLIYGGVSGLRGSVTTVLPGETPCLECYLPENGPTKPVPVLSAWWGRYSTRRPSPVRCGEVNV